MAKQKQVQIEWSLSNFRQLEFLRACGLSHPFDGGGAKAPAARIILFGGAAGGGKGQSLDSLVLTPFGYRMMRDIQVGSMVCNPDGSVATVIAVYPLGERQLYKVTFADNTFCEVTDDHIWLTWKSRGSSKSNGMRISGENGAKLRLTSSLYEAVQNGGTYNVPITNPVRFTCNGVYTKRVIHPYHLGVLLGDGCLRHSVTVGVADQEIADRVQQLCGDEINPIRYDEQKKMYLWSLKSISATYEQLHFMGLYGNLSAEKFIPQRYLVGTIEERWELLRGLMDTDGWAEQDGDIYYTSISKQLIKDVAFLARSLGAYVTERNKIPCYTHKGERVNGQKAYTARLKFTDNSMAFHLSRKKDLCVKTPQSMGRKIVSIEKTSVAECQCIKVSNPNGLYLTNDFIVTHNSDAMLVLGMIAALTFPGCNIGAFRREYPQLEGPGGIIMRSHELYNKLAKYHGGNRRWTFPKNSVLQFCHAKDEASVYGYQSQQFDILLIDESTQFTEFQLRYLLTRNRATVSHLIPFCAMATNPGGVSHGYHKKYFVDAGPPNTPLDVEIPEKSGLFEKHIFIPSRLSDNVILEERDPGYRLTLERQPDDIRRALLDGDWTVFEGQYFREFSVRKHVIEPFKIPDHWRKFGSIDWGFAAPCAFYLHTIDPSMGRVYTYKEIYVTQKRAGDMAQIVKDAIGDDEIEYIKMSPDAFHERGLGTKASPGEVVAEEFTKIGLNVEPADNRRVLGWQRMREFLSDAPDGKPWWQIFNNCHNLIRTIPEMIYDKNRVEDISKDGEDHSCESARYFLFSRPSPFEGSMFLPGSAEYFRSGEVEDDDDDMDDEPQEIDGFFGM